MKLFEDYDSLDHVELHREPQDGHLFIGCPLEFLRLAVEATTTSGELAVALYVYRLSKVRRSKTVKVANGALERELGINRWVKYRALRKLAKAKAILLHPRKGNTASTVTLLRERVRRGH
jgi:hypothetical protein